MPRAFVSAFALPVLFVLVVLAGTAANGRGGRGPIELTARELVAGERNADRSIADVWLAWSEPAGVPGTWLAPGALAEIGFDVSVDAASDEAERFYRRQVSRRAFVAFELDGPAWQAVLAERERTEAAVDPELRLRLRTNMSRLVPVAIAADGETLAARYPNARTHLVSAAIVGIQRFTPPGAPPYVGGTLINLDPRRIQLPVALAANVPVSRVDGAEQTPFRATLMYGRRWEPWVVSLEREGR